uniref:Uncharacterized protein n=1 Tax=Oryza rufipogon TaxID=4529 RepID=A0A0E0R9U2_ORYRU
MEVLGRQPCKREQELGWRSFHPSSAHQLFDGMPRQPEMSNKDQSISEPVPINSTMKKEEKWLDEALDRILEKFEQIEAKRRCDEKIDRILKKLDEIDANRNKFFEEMGASIKATTAPDLTVVASVTCTTLAVSSMVLLASDGTTGNTNIDAPVCFKETHAMCSMVGLDVNGGNDQAVVAFQTKTVVSKDVSASVHPMGNLATRLFVDKMMVQCELQPVPCETFNSYDTRVHILQPWPPTIKLELTSDKLVQVTSNLLELTSDKLVQVTSNLVRTCYMQKLGTREEHILKFKYACNGWPTRKFRKMPKNDCNGHWKMSRLFVNLNYFSFGLSTAKTVQKGNCYLRGSDKVLLTKLEMQSCVNLGDDN